MTPEQIDLLRQKFYKEWDIRNAKDVFQWFVDNFNLNENCTGCGKEMSPVFYCNTCDKEDF